MKNQIEKIVTQLKSLLERKKRLHAELDNLDENFTELELYSQTEYEHEKSIIDASLQSNNDKIEGLKRLLKDLKKSHQPSETKSEVVASKSRQEQSQSTPPTQPAPVEPEVKQTAGQSPQGTKPKLKQQSASLPAQEPQMILIMFDNAKQEWIANNGQISHTDIGLRQKFNKASKVPLSELRALLDL